MKFETPSDEKKKLADEQLQEADEMLGEKKAEAKPQHAQDREVTFEDLQNEATAYTELIAKHSEEVTAASKELMNTVQSLGAQKDGEWAVARAIDGLKKYMPRLADERFADAMAKKVRKDMIAELEEKQVELLNKEQLTKDEQDFAEALGETAEALKKNVGGAEQAA